MSIALAPMSDEFVAAAKAANIPLEVFHRIAALASGGMDTLPHNGAVITLLSVTGLTHRQAHEDVFVITLTERRPCLSRSRSSTRQESTESAPVRDWCAVQNEHADLVSN